MRNNVSRETSGFAVGDILDFTQCKVLGSFSPYGIVTHIYEDGSACIDRGTKEQVETKKRELGI